MKLLYKYHKASHCRNKWEREKMEVMFQDQTSPFCRSGCLIRRMHVRIVLCVQRCTATYYMPASPVCSILPDLRDDGAWWCNGSRAFLSERTQASPSPLLTCPPHLACFRVNAPLPSQRQPTATAPTAQHSTAQHSTGCDAMLHVCSTKNLGPLAQ